MALPWLCQVDILHISEGGKGTHMSSVVDIHPEWLYVIQLGSSIAMFTDYTYTGRNEFPNHTGITIAMPSRYLTYLRRRKEYTYEFC